MNNRPVDKTKRSNRRCVNCRYWSTSVLNSNYRPYKDHSYICAHSGKSIDYWNCCSKFEWSPTKTYK